MQPAAATNSPHTHRPHTAGLAAPLSREQRIFQAFERHTHQSEPHSAEPHDHSAHAQPNPETDRFNQRLKALGLAALFFTSAVMLRRIPARASGYQMIPTDWKQWAKVALGVMGIKQLNEGLNWEPPTWLGTMQTVAILNPLLQGFKRNSFQQIIILAPLITGLVMATRFISEKTEPFLQDKLNVPPTLTRIAFSLGSTLLGLKIIPPVLTKANQLGIMGNRSAATTTAMTTEALVCARGCCSSMICMSEIGEYAGALSHWIRGKTHHPVEKPPA